MEAPAGIVGCRRGYECALIRRQRSAVTAEDVDGTGRGDARFGRLCGKEGEVESSGGDRGDGMAGHEGVQEGTRLWGFE